MTNQKQKLIEQLKLVNEEKIYGYNHFRRVHNKIIFLNKEIKKLEEDEAEGNK